MKNYMSNPILTKEFSYDELFKQLELEAQIGLLTMQPFDADLYVNEFIDYTNELFANGEHLIQLEKYCNELIPL